MVSRSNRIRILLIVLAVLVLLVPFLYPTSRIQKEQLHVGVASTQWIARADGAILTMKITMKNDAAYDANIESLQFRIYKLIYPDNTTQDVDLNDTQVIHTTIPAGGNVTVNYAFEQPFTVGPPRAVLLKMTLVLQDGSSVEVFDGPINTTPQQQPS